jgi:hypothetical protein
LAGFFSVGYGLAFSGSFDVIQKFEAAGMGPCAAPMIVNLPVYFGSAAAGIAFAGTIAAQGRSWPLLWRQRPARNWLLAVLMAGFGVGGVFLYSVGSAGPAHPAPNISYGIFMSFFVVGGNLIGLATGELRSRSGGSRALLALGIAGLVASAVLLRVS